MKVLCNISTIAGLFTQKNKLMVRTVLMVILIFGCSVSYAQPPNMRLEKWVTDDNGQTYPKWWNAMPKEAVKETSDAYRDSSAARIKPVDNSPAFLETKFQFGSNQPDAFRAFVKTKIPEDDTVYMWAKLYNNGNLVANEKWSTSKTFKKYQDIRLYFEKEVNTDSAFVSFQSGCCAEKGGANSQTTLIIDELGYLETVGIKGSKKAKPVDVFPNPASEAFQIKGLKASNAYQYKLYNTLGQIAKRGSIQSQKPDISLKGLSNGVYQLILTNEKSGVIKSTKVVKR